MTWFSTPSSWGQESCSFLNRAGPSAQHASGQAPEFRRPAGCCQWSSSQKREKGEVCAGWKLWARGYPTGCPRRQASTSESGPRHVEGQGLSGPCELRHLPEPTHQQTRPYQAMFLSHSLTPLGQSLGLPGEGAGRMETDGMALLNLCSCCLPEVK